MTDTQHQHHDLQTVQAHVADLHTYHRNARQGDIGAISVSLNVNGQYRPIVVNRGTHTGRPNEVLAGNHTLMAARELGWPTLAAVFVDVDEDAATRIVLADNRTADLGTYDEHALADLIRSLDGQYEGSGYDGDDLDDLILALENSTLSLDELADDVGDPEHTDTWLSLSFKAPRHVHSAFLALVTEHHDGDYASALAALLGLPLDADDVDAA